LWCFFFFFFYFLCHFVQPAILTLSHLTVGTSEDEHPNAAGIGTEESVGGRRG
jgi:hypothetical protein